MPLVNCSECNTEISSKAAACPKCGNPLGKSSESAPKKKPGFLVRTVRIIFGGVAVVAAIGYFAESNSSTSSASSASVSNGSASVPSREPALVVTAGTLFRDYQANEVAADNHYKGRALHVRGTVQSINKDFTDDTYIQLLTDNEFMGVHANVTKDQTSAAASLRKGQQVTVTCTGAGMVVGSPMLKDCTITS